MQNRGGELWAQGEEAYIVGQAGDGCPDPRPQAPGSVSEHVFRVPVPYKQKHQYEGYHMAVYVLSGQVPAPGWYVLVSMVDTDVRAIYGRCFHYLGKPSFCHEGFRVVAPGSSLQIMMLTMLWTCEMVFWHVGPIQFHVFNWDLRFRMV